MNISSRTPEGLPARCPLCGAVTNLEFSNPGTDAPCPRCGHLLWLSANVLSSLQRRICDALGVPPDSISATTLFSEFGADSLDTIELVMELEEEFGVRIPDDAAEQIQSIGDLIRYLQQHRPEPPSQ